jgi:hypothetical protein
MGQLEYAAILGNLELISAQQASSLGYFLGML